MLVRDGAARHLVKVPLSGHGDRNARDPRQARSNGRERLIGLAEELARFRSDRAHAARFSSIADELERLDRAG